MDPTMTTERVPSPEQDVKENPAATLPATAQTRPGYAPTPTLPASPFGKVVEAVAAVMAEINPVEKGGKNTFHDYKYARMQDILQMLTPLMGKHGLAVFQYEKERQMFDDGKVLAIQYNFVVAHKSGETWLTPVPQTGMSPCRTSKGTFDDKSFAKCHTSARKYFLLSLFQIPTEDEADPDNQKSQRNAPVPGPGGHMTPHRIDPVKGETPKTWSTKYRNAIQAATNDAELVAWDNFNDDLLSQLSSQAEDIYTEVMKKFEGLRAKFGPQTKTQETVPTAPKDDPITTGPAPATKAARPTDCPNAEMEPDKFVAWAISRIDTFSDPAALTDDWEHGIMTVADGLFKPDVDALKAHYEQRLAKIGG